MGIDYKLFHAFILKFKKQSVKKDELEKFLQTHPEYIWDDMMKIIYLKSSHVGYYYGRLSEYFKSHPNNYVEENYDNYFAGIQLFYEHAYEYPDVSEIINYFGDQVEIIGWCKVGYLC